MPKGDYNFINYEPGHPIAGVTIERAAESLNGARWLCKHPCGHTGIKKGMELRATEKRGGKLRCYECAPKGAKK